MDKYSFSKLKNENDNCLKTEKDMIELQKKTIIFYGEKILMELENLKILLNTFTHHKEKREKKQLIFLLVLKIVYFNHI